MLTRAAKRALALQNDSTKMITSPSATGKGLHTRWQYPASTPPTSESSSDSDASFGSESTSLFHAPPMLSDSLSASSSSSSSSLSSLSDASSYSVAALLGMPDTPTRAMARGLQRSPVQRWTSDGKSDRLILVPDSFTPDAIFMRESIKEKKLDEVFHTQWAIMMKGRDDIAAAYGSDIDMDMDMEMDLGDDEDDEDMSDDESDLEFIREATEPVEEAYRYATTGSQGQTLGPHGTEIIDPDAYMAELAAETATYSRERAFAPSTGRALQWRATEKCIS